MFALLTAAPGIGQELPASTGEDFRIQTIDYGAGGIFHLQTSPETIQTVLLASGDQIRSVIISDPSAYVISVAASGDALTLKPNGANALAMVTIRTDLRSYDLELTASSTPAPSIFRFTYGDQPRQKAPTAEAPIRQAEGAEWRLSGSRALRPSEVSDDGAKTYIAWNQDQAMPAVFAAGPGSTERMVDGYMRGGRFTIDRVHDQLIFRMDNEVARAQRIKKRGRHDRTRVSGNTAKPG